MTSPVHCPTAWEDAAVRSAEVPDESVGALWRTLNYLSAAQLYLISNLRGTRKLAPSDVKARPRGHWGVCPPVNWMLAHLGPINAHRTPGTALTILHGAGHAGPSALAHAYLTRQLDRLAPGWSMDALHQLITGFPHIETYGSEISPLIVGACYTGGQLRPALAVAQGMVMDAPHHLAVPLIGDGECETGATAASWLASRALRNTGDHGRVLPAVLLNGLRMGAPSLLSRLSEDQIRGYFTGLGYTAFIHQGDDVASFRALLAQALARLQPLGSDGPHPLIVLAMPKGFTGPRHAGGKPILGTPAVHKTPLSDPRHRPEELTVLQDWLPTGPPSY
jgi:xylulose-5-phosphate/fructose-6-phosphate phosphoketolase